MPYRFFLSAFPPKSKKIGWANYAIKSYNLPRWIPRYLEDRLRRSVRAGPVLVLTGVRQTGKTSISRRLFPDCDFVSLDLPTEAEQAEKEPEVFLRRHPAPAIIDEVQYAPDLFRHLKTVVENRRNRYGQYLLTGSQKFVLMKGVLESLARRADMVEFEAKWTELPSENDTANLVYVQNTIGASRILAGSIVCRAANSFPLSGCFRATPISEFA